MIETCAAAPKVAAAKQATCARKRDWRAIELLQPGLGARPSAALLAGLLVIRDPLDVLGEAFLLTDLLKSADHLLRGLIAATLDLDHVALNLSAAVVWNAEPHGERGEPRSVNIGRQMFKATVGIALCQGYH